RREVQLAISRRGVAAVGPRLRPRRRLADACRAVAGGGMSYRNVCCCDGPSQREGVER
ncbi:hypothetical protein LCGC14_2735440, partial [marine sediment metagenome]